ncbi:MAG TPA: heme-binding domain-containing protein, partial [Anseongella sp.]
NNTDYPWYANVQPIGWWLDRHIRKGKEALNLDEVAGYSDRRKRSKLRSMKSQVANGEMPLRSYTLLHRDARLSDAQKAQLITWLDEAMDHLNQLNQK